MGLFGKRRDDDVDPVPQVTSQDETHEVTFQFVDGSEPYGMELNGGKVIGVVPGSLAEKLGVQESWCIAQVGATLLTGTFDGERRTLAAVTTDEIKALLRKHRGPEKSVFMVFWTRYGKWPPPRSQDKEYHAATAEDLRRLLLSKYETTGNAWEQLDPEDKKTLTQVEFCKGIQDMGITCNFAKVLVDIDPTDSHKITLEMLDPFNSFDPSKGKCQVCTLPNPCRSHSPSEQRAALKQFLASGAKLPWELGL
mmetsp:Transcript_45615/g.120613  ORF Transcript_45615/g.120613 Transcript_45615/m.120613 type:complete len:252 (+) Transcript_45615:21-776(+)